MADRKDSKGRILHRGESQREDGRYRFKYTDASGKERNVYSWTLTIHDSVPRGKKGGSCLREKEKLIQRSLLEGLVLSDMTVLELAERYVSTKLGVRESARAGYRTVINFLRKDDFGSRKISNITFLDARSWIAGFKETGAKATALFAA